MNSSLQHPDPGTLLRLVDEDLSQEESAEIGAHLSACAHCRDQICALREALDAYGRFHRGVLRASLPAAPREWAQLKFPNSKRIYFRPATWLSAVAAAGAVLFFVFRFVH